MSLQQTLEAFVTISVLSQLLYEVLLHTGVLNNRYGPGNYANSGNHGGGNGGGGDNISMAGQYHVTRKASSSTTVIS